MRISLHHALALSYMIESLALSKIAPFSKPTCFSTHLNVEGPRTEVDGSTKSTKSDGDFFTEVVVQPKTKRTRKRKRGPPVVDSSLLRFLSSQKKDQNTTIPPNKDKSRGQSEGEGEDDQTTNTADLEQSGSSGGADNLWLGSYQSETIAQRLIELDVKEDVAREAGLSVENHVRERTARRRVREFLKERDMLWMAGQQQNDTTALLEGLPGASPPPPLELQYCLDDNIELMGGFGLTAYDIATTLIHTPSVAIMMTEPSSSSEELGGETLKTTLMRGFQSVVCESLGLRGYDARMVLRNTPGLLTRRGSKRAEEVVTLLTSLGVSKYSIARDRTALPRLLARSPSSLFRLVSFLASDAVRMPVKNIGPLLKRKECVELLNAVAPVVSKEMCSVSKEEGGADACVLKTPSLKSRQEVNELYKNMTKTALMLRNGIGTEDLGKVVAAYPSVLLLDIEEQLLPAANFLMGILGSYESDLPSVLQLYPMLLGRSVDSMLRRIQYLRSLGVEEESLSSMLRAFPKLLTMNVEEKMVPVVNFLREIGISNVGRFVTRLPPVLGYSVDYELRPKWEFLQKVCLYPSFELSAFPAYFSYPLERVIKARYEYLIAIKKAPTQLLALDLVVRHGDKDFAILVAKDGDGGEGYAAFTKARKERWVQARKQRRRRMPEKKRSSNSEGPRSAASDAARLRGGNDEKS